MAFGKDPSHSANIPTFRQQGRAQQAARPKSVGYVKPYFIDAFKPSTDDPDQVRVLKGRYEVQIGQPDGSLITQVLYYQPYCEHFHGTMKKGFMCSAGPFSAIRDKREPCMGCDQYWAARAAGNKNGPMSKRDMYAFTVLHYAPYAKVEQIDRTTGQVRTNTQGEPYTEWHRVFPHERAKYAGREMCDARVLHWSLGFGHWNTLMEYDKEIGRSCKSCGGRDTIKMVAWTCDVDCGGCGEALIEGDTTTLSPKEIDELTGAPVKCGACGHVGLLKEMVDCTNCDHGERAEIFDVDLNVKRIADPNGGNANTLGITSWSNPRPIDARYIEIAKPMDLAKIFAATPIEKQGELLGFQGGGGGGRQPVTAGQHSRAFQGPTLGGNK